MVLKIFGGIDFNDSSTTFDIIDIPDIFARSLFPEKREDNPAASIIKLIKETSLKRMKIENHLLLGDCFIASSKCFKAIVKPLPPRLTIIISAIILIATSSGVSASISNPTGA